MPKPKAPADPHRIGSGCWSDWEEPDYLPGPSEGAVFFGADPSWTPADESQSPYTCRRCGGKGLVVPLGSLEEPIPIPLRFDPELYAIVVLDDDPIRSGRVCAACVRWSRDHVLSRLRSDGPVPVAIAEGGTVPLRAEPDR